MFTGDADEDVPPSQSVSFTAAAWARAGDHPTWLLLSRGLDHYQTVRRIYMSLCVYIYIDRERERDR